MKVTRIVKLIGIDAEGDACDLELTLREPLASFNLSFLPAFLEACRKEYDGFYTEPLRIDMLFYDGQTVVMEIYEDGASWRLCGHLITQAEIGEEDGRITI